MDKKIKVEVVTVKKEEVTEEKPVKKAAAPKKNPTKKTEHKVEVDLTEVKKEVGVNTHLNPAVSDVYVIDFDRVQTIDDIKRLLKALDLSFLETTPGFFKDVKDLLKLKEPKKIKK